MNENGLIAQAAGLIDLSFGYSAKCPVCNEFNTNEHEDKWYCRDCRSDNGFYLHETNEIETHVPDWRSDPGACATYLLPVLEKREPNVVFDRDGENESGPWLCSIGRLDELIYSPTWHEAVIAAILATREDA